MADSATSQHHHHHHLNHLENKQATDIGIWDGRSLVHCLSLSPALWRKNQSVSLSPNSQPGVQVFGVQLASFVSLMQADLTVSSNSPLSLPPCTSWLPLSPLLSSSWLLLSLPYISFLFLSFLSFCSSFSFLCLLPLLSLAVCHLLSVPLLCDMLIMLLWSCSVFCWSVFSPEICLIRRVHNEIHNNKKPSEALSSQSISSGC